MAALVLVAQAPTAQADTASGGEQNEISEVVVTAEKRSERLSDVPISVTAVSGEELVDRGVSDPRELVKLVPGFTYQQSNFGVPVFSIRGVGFLDTTLAASPTVSVYTDQVPLPYLAMARGAMLDLERVEVLKGPQGTLFGENSTGGAINFIAARPTPELSAGASLTYGRFNEFDSEAFVSGPLSAELRGRLSIRTEQQGDWQYSYTRSDSLGAKHFFDGRALLDWLPSDRLKFTFSISGWKDTSDTQQPQFWYYTPTVPPPYGRAGLFAEFSALPTAPRNDRSADWVPGRNYARNDRFYQGTVRGDLDISPRLTLTSITAYSRLFVSDPLEVDGTPLSGDYLTVVGDVYSLSQELRLTGRANERLRWMVGANYQRDRSREDQESRDVHTSNSQLPTGTFDAINAINNQDVRTKAAFASLDYDLVPDLTAQVSARYTDQRRSFEGCTADDGDGQLARVFGLAFGNALQPGDCITMYGPPSPTPFKTTGLFHENLNQDNVSWRTSLNWKPTGDVLIYGNVTKGYKAGGFPTLPSVFTIEVKPVTQESILAYETGFKVSALERRLQLSGAIFYYDYKDKQIVGFLLVPPFGNLSALVSLPKSRIEGGELELTWRPTGGLRITAGATYVDSRVLSDPANAFNAYGVPTSFIGEQFPNTPRWQGVLDIEERFALGAGLTGFVGGVLSGRSSSPAALGDTPGFSIWGYTLLDLRAGVEKGAWAVQLWGRNVTNKYYITNVARVSDTNTYFTGMPATFGVTASYRFK